MKVGISGCLNFFNCRYDGACIETFDLEKAKEFLKKELSVDCIEFIPVCPEQLGGLTTPRSRAEIVGGTGEDILLDKAKLYTVEGRNVTVQFQRGAHEVLNFARKFDIKVFILTEHSPSCGSNHIYSGEFNDNLIPGMGVTTALLRSNGITVYSDFTVKGIKSE